MSEVKSDIQIAREAKMQPINDILAKINVPDESSAFSPMGRHIAKINLEYLDTLKDKPNGKLVLVTAITPTPAGEGKTTTSVGLNDGLNKIGKKSIVCLREPSLGPSFGMKGGAAGGGYAQVVPMEQINLHFTGDFHAITSAHNLLSALIDNHIYWGNKLDIDVRRIVWKRVMDMNDRSLRSININLGGVANGFPREDGFDITVASEIMAIFCLSNDLEDLEKRIGNITIAYTRDKKPVYAKDLKAQGPMTVLLKDAIRPNVTQTLENNPAIIHGGPFANIAHGCNSVIATKTGLKLADYVVTEAGFGADLGAEKFLDIKCRKSDLKPSCVVIVATIRALKMHGGVAKDDLKTENVEALKKGLVNLQRHVENVKKFGLPVAVAVNHFIKDTENEVKALIEFCDTIGVKASLCTHWANGGEGTKELASHVAELCEKNEDKFKFLYESKTPLFKKIETIAKEIYRADEVIADTKIRDQLKSFEDAGYGDFPICIAKTQYSFSTDPSLKGAPTGHSLPIREIKLSSGAEFIVVICGAVMTMPGLPRVPAADSIKLNKDGEIEGLF
ncbi:formate--tetrahydrofolate ligase [Candidatus Pelagibacter ubique]|jgi:formate--tetrahydrofolate ligase|uniref:Formate--tetrahydrofolate ligase n=1 Tax=Pelagibacter ubique (strain HTCC1062) TaxID=335992 RepID=FTHS_PELUB|nr:formate--tetrahydrofolate ligase [Candidatus Pelagibacter ubique]Q4FL49.1 RecName: Full=Formate--tetrahydrofolate ligase; AltName: Full=Formyltetrahydrofolate synthetase; Short=FHS; Short=FTHFS [Candidatus Pelagibacter ubique HTCC1062]AAZ22089.1 formate-tetrahydrofolate ligase [Candidatus Pelagibacter ubique HTCC1062]MDA7454321.1 formate--tetrahydrofolate ligase [Candidatus Pelagibacter ubique]MDA8932831.1 formate--tetrahydrofolate ligase [Candidatus Pelagibacter ubique]MDA9063256.1 formate